jgi:hypothetical protein
MVRIESHVSSSAATSFVRNFENRTKLYIEPRLSRRSRRTSQKKSPSSLTIHFHDYNGDDTSEPLTKDHNHFHVYLTDDAGKYNSSTMNNLLFIYEDGNPSRDLRYLSLFARFLPRYLNFIWLDPNTTKVSKRFTERRANIVFKRPIFHKYRFEFNRKPVESIDETMIREIKEDKTTVEEVTYDKRKYNIDTKQIEPIYSDDTLYKKRIVEPYCPN